MQRPKVLAVDAGTDAQEILVEISSWPSLVDGKAYTNHGVEYQCPALSGSWAIEASAGTSCSAIPWTLRAVGQVEVSL